MLSWEELACGKLVLIVANQALSCSLNSEGKWITLSNSTWVGRVINSIEFFFSVVVWQLEMKIHCFLEAEDKNDSIFKEKWGGVCFLATFLECSSVTGFITGLVLIVLSNFSGWSEAALCTDWLCSNVVNEKKLFEDQNFPVLYNPKHCTTQCSKTETPTLHLVGSTQ